MPAAIRVLCMDMALIHGLASEHPEVLEYSAEARWDGSNESNVNRDLGNLVPLDFD
jgi:hypothetical protein